MMEEAAEEENVTEKLLILDKFQAIKTLNIHMKILLILLSLHELGTVEMKFFQTCRTMVEKMELYNSYDIHNSHLQERKMRHYFRSKLRHLYSCSIQM